MAANNMMEILKQIQRDLADQKAYMRNLHVINKNLNEKLNIMEEHFSELPQALITIEKLEHQVKKNNMLLFGNDETEKISEDKAFVPYKTEHDVENNDHLAKPPENGIDYTKETLLHNSPKVSVIEEAENNIKAISQLNTELRRIMDFTQSEIKEIKELIKNADAASKLSIQEATVLHKQEIILRESNQSAIMEIKEIIKDLAKKMSIEDTANKVREQKIVKISPTYFTADQLSKLNSKLKRIAEMYQETNIFPVIEVKPGVADEHPVMKQLCEGVYYRNKRYSNYYTNSYKLKIGYDGFSRSDVIDIITNYPNLSLNEVVKQWMVATNKWDKWSEIFDFSKPFTLGKNCGIKLYPTESVTVVN